LFSIPVSAQNPVCDYDDYARPDPVLYCFQLLVTPAGAVGGTSNLVHVTMTVNEPIRQSEGVTFQLDGHDVMFPSDPNPFIVLAAGQTSVTIDAYAVGPVGQSDQGYVVAVRQTFSKSFFMYSNFFSDLPTTIVIQPDKTTVGSGGSVTLIISFSDAMRSPQTLRAQDVFGGQPAEYDPLSRKCEANSLNSGAAVLKGLYNGQCSHHTNATTHVVHCRFLGTTAASRRRNGFECRCDALLCR